MGEEMLDDFLAIFNSEQTL